MNKNEIIAYQSLDGKLVEITPQAVKDVITKGNPNIDDNEVETFINLCKFQQLNPFVNEAYLLKYDNKKPATMVVAKEALQKRAELNPQYDGQEDGIVVVDDNGNEKDIVGAIIPQGFKLLGGWCKVYRKDRRMPTTVRVAFKEYNKGQSSWVAMPSTMIRKVAIAQALRGAFPNALGNLYAEEEISMQQPTQEPMQAVDATDFDEEEKQDNLIIENKNDEIEPSLDEIESPFEEPKAEESEWFEIPYSEYRDNKDKYEQKRNSYDPTTKMILVRRI